MRTRRDITIRSTSTASHPVRAVPAVALLAAVLGFAGAPVVAAAEDTDSTSVAVDGRVGLLDEAWRLWRIPVRYAASRSPYFQPGLPPYRQQPEKAQQQPLPEAGDSATETAAPIPSPSPSSSDSSEGSSKSPSGGSEGSSSDSSESSTPTLTLIEPTPTFTPVEPVLQPGEAPTPTQTPSGP